MMFEIRDFQTIYNMVVASFIILTFSIFYDNYTKQGEVVDMTAFFGFFRGTHITLAAWLLLSVIFYSIILVLKLALKTSKVVWMPVYLLHISSSIWVSIQFSRNEELGFASVIIIMAESIRMIMKAHSYFRTKLLYLKENDYRHFEFRGLKVVNSRLKEMDEQHKGKCLNIDIKNGDVFN